MASLRLSLFAFLALVSGSALAGNLKVNLAPAEAVTAGAQWRVDGGVWRASGVTVKNLTNAPHTVEYKAVAGWVAPAPATVTLSGTVTTTVTGTYVRPGSVTVTLTPSNAQWSVDGGAWRNSGTTATNLAPGNRSISYNALADHIAPPTESVTVTSGQTTNLARSYAQLAKLTVVLSPTTATWRLDGGAAQPSGATLTGLTPGAHSISYDAAPGYTTPATEAVTLVSGQTTSVQRAYTPLASLTVVLSPSSGTWRLNNGPVQPSGATLTGITPGVHSISYTAVSGYMTPANESVTLVSGETTTVERAYTALANLTVKLSEASAYWQLDSGAWQPSGKTLTGLTPGSHTISYSNATSRLTPPTETVTLVSGQTTVVERTYTPSGSVFVMLNPNTAKWRIDGGDWRATHTNSGQIAAGSHTIEYSAVPNMIAPPVETVNVGVGQNLNISKIYDPEATLTINLTPAVGQWRVRGGAWRNSGETVAQLAQGNHLIEYSAAPDYSAPPAETITLYSGDQKTLARSYLRPASLTVLITPTEGQWRMPNGSWQPSGTTLGGLRPGSYSIQFSSVPGWFDVSGYVTVAEGESKTVSYAHVQQSSITVTLAPGVAQWRMNGGAWQPSGTRLGALSRGNYTIDYSSVADMTAPASETFSLAEGENKALTRSYGGASSLTVNLAPAAGQWRMDGGAWRASGTIMFNLPLGAHQIEYAPVPGYLTPPAETVSFRQNQSLNLTRTYLDATGAYLDVRTRPAYITETGVAKWRVNGGAWHTAGAPVALPAGTHTLEFEPVPGLDAPASSSVTVNAGAVQTLEATYHMPHRLRFFLQRDLVAGLSTETLQARLAQYAADLQTIWHRESLRRLLFDPTTDITIVDASPFSNNAFSLPEYGFELWAYADKSAGSTSHGGNVALDISGAGGADGMHWTQVYDPSTLVAGSRELWEYSKQLSTLTHEFEHAFGAGLGEYYAASDFDDLTGVEPIYSVDYFAPQDPFWNAHSNFWADPLLRNVWDNYRIGAPTAMPALLEAVRFADTTRGIIDGCYRTQERRDAAALPDLSRVRIRVVDAITGELVPGATLRVWNQPKPGDTSLQERTVTAADSAGLFEFNWKADPGTIANGIETGRLLKACAEGYQPKAQWEWIFDAQRVKTVDRSDTWEITVALDRVP